ncbi:putative ferric-chelate reductase 1 [Oppia nitens]|uniref:putative ferric-chelate reductase 1 n=1 Tax=Oppia nitens TaxID=1686743 RepID=UPI0023DA0AF8|nr:putative ferric-chelate reductase 1 [Oppia nitens]
MQIIIQFCLVVLLGTVVNSWPSGAPESVCNTLTPKHGESQARGAESSPYNLVQSHQDYVARDRIKVTLSAPQGQSFRGLIVQAYDPHTGAAIGKFEAGKGLKAIDSCAAVTHTDRRGKRSATLVWTAPESGRGGNVAFRGTAVQSFSDFYTNLHSSVNPNI